MSKSASAESVEILDLAALDREQADTLALFCFSDVRPLLGAAALLDWRLGGRLSEALLSGALRGERDECVLLPTQGRLGRRRLFVLGLGPQNELTDEALARACERAVIAMCDAGGQAMALLAPTRPDRSNPERDDPLLLAQFLRQAAPKARQQQVRLLAVRLQ